jgi:cytochrome oxidase assembly protein ShyY1
LIIFQRFSVSTLPLVVTLAAFVVMCKLGFWQLDRAEQKRQQIALFTQQGEITTEELLPYTEVTLVEINGRKVALQGKIVTDKIWLLDNKTHNGKVGYNVITPLLLQAVTEQAVAKKDVAEQGKDKQILVNWGWLQASKYRSELPSVKLPDNIELTGVARTTDFKQFSLQQGQKKEQDESGWPKRVQSASNIIANLDTRTILPVMVYADTNENINYPQTYKPVVMPPEKHQAYAVQWFLLALSSLLVFMFASFHKGKQIRKTPTSSLKENNEN